MVCGMIRFTGGLGSVAAVASGVVVTTPEEAEVDDEGGFADNCAAEMRSSSVTKEIKRLVLSDARNALHAGARVTSRGSQGAKPLMKDLRFA